MFTKEEILGYHCPRYSELPDVELYMDQVISLLERYTGVIVEDSKNNMTGTMINNYVKQKLIRAPKNKKYDKGQLCFFIIVAILKKVMALSEISESISLALEVYSPEKAFDLFGETLEDSIACVFNGKASDFPSDGTEIFGLYRSLTSLYANLLYSKYIINKQMTEKNGDN